MIFGMLSAPTAHLPNLHSFQRLHNSPVDMEARCTVGTAEREVPGRHGYTRSQFSREPGLYSANSMKDR